MKTLLVIVLLFALKTPAFASFWGLPSGFGKADASAKTEYVWTRKILPSQTTYSTLRSVCQIALELPLYAAAAFTLGKSFDTSRETRRWYRPKIIHRDGSVVRFFYRTTPEAKAISTGILAEGGEGLGRLSLALPLWAGQGYRPGMALKFFFDGSLENEDGKLMTSVNVSLMNTVSQQKDPDGTPNKNFFKRAFSNRIPQVDPAGPGETILLRLFRGVLKNPFFLPIAHLSAINPDGSVVQRQRSPTEITAEPSAAVRNLIPSDTTKHLQEHLATIPAGTLLYTVWAVDAQGGKVHMGDIETTSEFVYSTWADGWMSFAHQMPRE